MHIHPIRLHRLQLIVACILSWPVANIAHANPAAEQFLLQALQEEEVAQGSVSPVSSTQSRGVNTGASEGAGSQIELIDQEIIILRAELAHSQNQVEQVRLYLDKLNAATVFPVFKARYLTLLQSLSTPVYTAEPSVPKTTVIEMANQPSGVMGDDVVVDTAPFAAFKPVIQSGMSSSFKVDYQNAGKVIVVLLPMSGDYAAAGKQLWQGINDSAKKQGVRAKLVLFDTEEYGSIWSLWQEAKVHAPILVLGPLRKELAHEFQALKTQVPTLFFNPLLPLMANERSLLPNRNAGLSRILSVLDHQENQSVLVLSEDETVSSSLEKAFDQAWSNENRQGDYYQQTLQKKGADSSVGQVLEMGLNVVLSKNRAKVLENIVQEPVQFKPRIRQDIGAVVSFLSHRQATQAAPFLRFLGDSSIHHIWYPGQMPSMALLAGELKSWPKTYGVLPFYGVNNADAAIKELKNENSGLFYALGKTAIQMVTLNAFLPPNNDTLLDQQEPIELEAVRAVGNGQFQLLPTLYWMDQGTFSPLTEAMMYEQSLKRTLENEE